MDYEAELAFAVGRAVCRATGDDALAAVGGYTLANDLSMRDHQYKTHQWLPGKNWVGSTPLGPFLVTAGPARHDRRVVDIESLERGREPVGVALAPDLPVRDDVEPCALLVGDRERGGVVLGLGEIRLRDTP